MNKTMLVLEHLKENGSITSWEAIQKYRATRLSAIIYNLKYKYGYKIKTVMKDFIDSNGEKSKYGVYYLEGKEDNNENN